jgi:hypothetical protein
MRRKLVKLKADGELLRGRSDLVWYLLLQSAATLGNSRGQQLMEDHELLGSVAYVLLAPLSDDDAKARILAALQKAKVRMASIKAPRLMWNLRHIEKKFGGVEQATQTMLARGSREAKIEFMKQFQGVGDKYGRNVWMDIYDPAFRESIAVDERIKKMSASLGFEENNYGKHEAYYCGIARDAGLEPWEVDRLLYHFNPHFLASIE